MKTSSGRSWLALILSAAAVALVAYLVPSIWSQRNVERIKLSITKFNETGQSDACLALAISLQDSVFTEQHPDYVTSHGYWSNQAAEDKPTCVVRPINVQEVSVAVDVLKRHYDVAKSSDDIPKFAVRSGGYSPEAGFSSVNGGVLIDTSRINSVAISEDKTQTVIGTGARWLEVMERLDSQGLAVAGGRNAGVGVGGSSLGGGISFYSAEVGMVCDNIIAYQIVLANGTIAEASSMENPDLWRALKGGSGNFGIVTHITARTFPGAKIWAGWLYSPINQAPKLIRAFNDFAKYEKFDKNAATPILSFGYVQTLGVRAAAVHLAYTKPEKWPDVYRGFKRGVWRLWSTTRVQSQSDAVREISALSPKGNRQFHFTTTIKNDYATITHFFEEYSNSIDHVRKTKGIIWSLMFQSLSTSVTHKGSSNSLGLGSGDPDVSLIIILATATWKRAADDEFVYATLRKWVAECDAFAVRRGTADKFRYLNYAASGQRPFDGYGEENKVFLQETSRSFDPSGFWQRAKVGGFKLFDTDAS